MSMTSLSKSVFWPTRVASTPNFTRVTGEKMESMGITPMGMSGRLLSSLVAKPRPTLTSISASNLPLRSKVQMIWSLLMT
jgi:hypothetical protein